MPKFNVHPCKNPKCNRMAGEKEYCFACDVLAGELAAVKTIGLKLVKENQWLMEKYNKTQPIDGNLADAQTAGEFTEALKGKEKS